MSFLLWQAESDLAIGSSRLVLRADEVPLLRQAQQLRDELEMLRREEAQRIEVACEAARAQARALGLEQGRHAARDELAATISTLAQAAAQERVQQRKDVAALALQVVRKLLGQVAAETQLVALAETAAREMLPTPAMTLWVHPDRCGAVRTRLAQRAGEADGTPAFEVRGDAGCAVDDCHIETELGRVEASLDAQLARLAGAWGVTACANAQGAAR